MSEKMTIPLFVLPSGIFPTVSESLRVFEPRYKQMLDHFTEKSGKTQRDLTNGVNQMIASAYDYTVGKPGNSNTADHILAKVAKDNEVDSEKYLSVEGYLTQVEEYVTFITKSPISGD